MAQPAKGSKTTAALLVACVVGAGSAVGVSACGEDRGQSGTGTDGTGGAGTDAGTSTAP